MAAHLSDRRDWITDFIHDFSTVRGYAPTVREITDGVGLSSTSATYHHLARLRKEGVIDWVPGAARTIRILERKY